MNLELLLDDFVADWKVRGLSPKTVNEYRRYLRLLMAEAEFLDLRSTRVWLESIESLSVRRQAARAIRSFGKYLEIREIGSSSWWKNLPLPIERVSPQKTVTQTDLSNARMRCKSLRDQVLVELLWSTGIRRSELSRVCVEDFDDGFRSLLVKQTKSGRPRRIPLSPQATQALSSFLCDRQAGSLLSLSSAGIGAVLKRLDLPPAHAWRRGWAVDSLRRGISEVSVRTAAGWTTGAMVARYTASLSEELALAEFERSWSDPSE